jgi:hypothetical protein
VNVFVDDWSARRLTVLPAHDPQPLGGRADAAAPRRAEYSASNREGDP